VDIVDPQTLVVLNDNNYPGSGGRGPTPDENELIEIRLDQPLDVARGLIA
jgi:hypothetical protein